MSRIKTLILISALAALSGCAPKPESGSRTVLPASQAEVEQAENFPNPGPFKLKEMRLPDGKEAEFWQARGETGNFGGTLTAATFGSGPKTFNFWAAGDVESDGIGYLMWDKLVDTDAWTGSPYPRLARSIEISRDKLDYIVRLREGLTWSDGLPITADDVVYTFQTIVGKRFGHQGASLHDTLSVNGNFPTIAKLDDLTVKFHTPVPFAPFLSELAGMPIAPRHVLEPVTDKGMAEFETFWSINCRPEDMVTSGRFKLERYVPGQRVELVRNPNYSFVDRLGRRLPYLDRFVLVVVPDQNTMLLKFYGNELDLLDIRYIRGSDAALMKERESSGNFRMHNLGPDDGTMFFMVNMCRRKDPQTGRFYVDPIKQEWFNDVNFRQAINHALDRRRMVDNILRGVGLPLYTAETTASVYFNPDLKPYPQDLQLAAGLLCRSGFVRRGGLLYDRHGHRVEFTLNTNAGNSVREAAAVMIVNDLQKLGMKVNLQPIDFNTMINKIETSLDWESVVMGNSGTKLEPYDGANVWKSDGRLHMFDQRLPDDEGRVMVPDARPWERRIDRLFDLAATTFDPERRKGVWHEYQKIVYEEQPFIYLYSTLDLTANRNKIGNYKPMPLGVFYTPMGSLHNIEEIYIRKEGGRPDARRR